MFRENKNGKEKEGLRLNVPPSIKPESNDEMIDRLSKGVEKPRPSGPVLDDSGKPMEITQKQKEAIEQVAENMEFSREGGSHLLYLKIKFFAETGHMKLVQNDFSYLELCFVFKYLLGVVSGWSEENGSIPREEVIAQKGERCFGCVYDIRTKKVEIKLNQFSYLGLQAIFNHYAQVFRVNSEYNT